MADGVTVDGSDFFAIVSGSAQDATAESGDTAAGTGKALKLAGAVNTVDTARAADYGNLSPTWVEYVVKPGMGADQRDVPTDGIAAVNFGSTGRVMVSNGSSWVDSGKDFIDSAWYRVLLKLDFSTHTYEIYSEPATAPQSPFVPLKQNLNFINPAINSMSRFGFAGAYNISSPSDDSRVDEVVVHYVSRLQFITSPQTLVKGHPSGQMTVQLQNANAEPQTAWRDITVELRSSFQTGEFSLDKDEWTPITSAILPEGAQQASFYYMDFNEGKPMLSANEFPDRGWTDATQEQKVVDEGEFFTVTADAVQTAGAPFVLRVTAMDGQGGTDTTYSGAVNLSVQYVSPASGTKMVTPDNAAGFALGVVEVTTSYPDAGIVKFMVQDQADSFKAGYSGDILFVPDSFNVTADPAQIVGRNFPVTVKALETEGQTALNYQGPAVLQAVGLNPAGTSGGAFNPAEVPAGSFQNGAAVFNTAYDRWGIIAIKASDAVHAEKEGVSDPVKFSPKAISVTVKPPSPGRAFFYQGENMEITVSMLNQNDLPVENYAGAVSLTALPAFDIQSQAIFSEADKGQKKFVAPAPGTGKYVLKAENVEDNLTAQSGEFEVKEAVIVVSNTSSPVGVTSVEIQLVDENGNRIKEENEMTVTILVQEENENGSVFFSELGKPILFKKGVAKIVLGDSEAETVTISARSKYGLRVANGKVIFGRAGAIGVGTLMLREQKE